MSSSPIVVQRDTKAWQLQVWVSFGIAVFLCAVGLAWLPRGRVGNDLRDGRLVEADRKGTAIRFEIRLYRPRSARNELVQRIWAASQAA